MYVLELDTVNDTSTKQEEIESTFTLNVYPNPFTNQLHVPFIDANSIRLLTIQGKELNTSIQQQHSDWIVDTEAVPVGLCLLEITQNGQRFYKKLLKTTETQ